MKILILITASIISVFLNSCCDCDNEENTLDNLTKENVETDTETLFPIEKFSLPYPYDLMLDNNALIFYCGRNFDTSSLLHLQETKAGIKGVFYEILPAYHQFPEDFISAKNELVFLEGYSFLLDSIQWTTIKDSAQMLLQTDDSKTTNNKVTDEDIFVLCHNKTTKRSNADNQTLFETFDKFLKNYFLQNFINSRIPKAHQIKSSR